MTPAAMKLGDFTDEARRKRLSMARQRIVDCGITIATLSQTLDEAADLKPADRERVERWLAERVRGMRDAVRAYEMELDGLVSHQPPPPNPYALVHVVDSEASRRDRAEWCEWNDEREAFEWSEVRVAEVCDDVAAFQAGWFAYWFLERDARAYGKPFAQLPELPTYAEVRDYVRTSLGVSYELAARAALVMVPALERGQPRNRPIYPPSPNRP